MVDQDFLPEAGLLLEKEKAELRGLHEYIDQMMKEGVDYGLLPRTDKKCLFKPGAEKLCSVYGLAPLYEVLSRTEDFAEGLFSYEVKVQLKNKITGIVEAEGAGICNSFESKYTKQDKYNIANTVLKMAKKRAFVDATLLATRSSDIFTQDMEESASVPKQSPNEASRLPEESSPAEPQEMASSKQLSYIFTLLSQKRIPVETARGHLKENYGKADTKYLNKDEASDYIHYLLSYKAS